MLERGCRRDEIVDRGNEGCEFVTPFRHPSSSTPPPPPLGMLLSPLRAALRSSSAVTPATLTSSVPSAVASFRFLASASPSADQSATRQTTSIPPPSMEDAIRTKVRAALNRLPAL